MGPSLQALAERLGEFSPRLSGDSHVQLTDVHQDSRAVTPQSLFVARTGASSDGASFVQQAVARGASAVMSASGLKLSLSLPHLEVQGVERALAIAAEYVHGSPSQQLKLVGITGTNGKTTTASLLTQCLRYMGCKTGQLGTLGFESVSGVQSSSLTTPEADVTSRYLGEALSAGATHFIMEVSSHALVKERVAGLTYAVAGFSNLSQDHLDFHSSMADYGESKARLFLQHKPNRSVINIDDDFGLKLATRLHEPLRVGRAPDAEIRLLSERPSQRGCSLAVSVQGRPLEFETNVVGAHNVDNWLLTLGLLSALELDLSSLPDFSGKVGAAPGRLERCETAADTISVFVDYAHTPDALKRALQALRPIARGRLLCVFGCGGDRDKTKRPLMAAVSTRYADRTIITSDNPRTEDPEQILRDIEMGVPQSSRSMSVVDRAEAIRLAIMQAQPGDVLMIAGKGHEDYQILGTKRIAFDDRAHARDALAERRVSEGSA